MKIFTEKSSKNLIWIGVLLLFIGVFSFQIGEIIFDYNSEIKSDKIGQLGDFIGGVIGSIWTLAGVILFYVAFNKQVEALEDQKKSTIVAINSLKIQSNELQLQRTELKETRKEFLMNRTTNIVYHQLDRFEKNLNELIIKDFALGTLNGKNAMLHLYEKMKVAYKGSDETIESYNQSVKESLIHNLKICLPNKANIETFAVNAYNSVSVLKRLIFKTDININELDDIKNIFFENIGYVNMQVIRTISEISKQEIEHLKYEDYINNQISPDDAASLYKAKIFLSSIIEFYDLRLTVSNYEEEKRKWIKEKGQ